ncbi:MAG TPA: hypothetical protein P5229_04350 [Candidatus Gracilibacteria bacterium]|nr:hypothetical protein [Candidatus Gracilibacteria bacterium]HRY91541.1 hypothetical protein [Candidatus Gracilibacteria bacterium]
MNSTGGKAKKRVMISSLLKPVNFMFFFGSALVFFDLQYFMMANLPGTRDNMCVDGANLTPVNIIFSLLLSVAIGLVIASMLELIALKQAQRKITSASMSGVAFGIGALTLFCPICALPVISLFGFSLGLGFINDFNLILKLVSLALLGGAIYLINGQLNNNCALCEYVAVKSDSKYGEKRTVQNNL